MGDRTPEACWELCLSGCQDGDTNSQFRIYFGLNLMSSQKRLVGCPLLWKYTNWQTSNWWNTFTHERGGWSSLVPLDSTWSWGSQRAFRSWITNYHIFWKETCILFWWWNCPTPSYRRTDWCCHRKDFSSMSGCKGRGWSCRCLLFPIFASQLSSCLSSAPSPESAAPLHLSPILSPLEITSALRVTTSKSTVFSRNALTDSLGCACS